MWSIVGGPYAEALPGGGDAIAYVWTVEREGDGERRIVRVEISRTALASGGLPTPISEVVASKGAEAVLGFAHWNDPPETVTVSTTGLDPFPGSPDPAA